MDSSSDGSFAWTDASNDTIDSEIMPNDNMNKHQSEDESEKVYKKKLQEELFAQSNGTVEKEKQLKPKERKRKVTEEQSASEHESPKKKKIKKEPESDIDVPVTKHKGNYHNGDVHDNDEYYLDLKVKAEQQIVSPDKSKKHVSESISNSHLHEDSSVTTNIKPKRNSKRHSHGETDLEDNKLDQLVQEETESYERKVKKKKKKTNKRVSDETRQQESYTEEGECEESEAGSQTLAESANNVDSYVHEKVKNNKNISRSSSEEPDDCREITGGLKQQLENGNKSVSFNILDESVKQTTKTSERIQFEEDDSSDHEIIPISNRKTPIKSSKLKSFLKNNLNLKPFTSKLNNDSSLTDNDEIWIVRCPKDVDVEAFQNKDFTLEGKCKLKLNSQTYEGIIDNECTNVSVLALEQSKFVVKSLSVNGYLNLRKRIPKSHIQDDAMASTQTSFIPLPETKCRHPLFGSNYRKAIKVSPDVAARLAPAPGPARALSLSEPDQLLHCKKKKKKRKHLDCEEPVPKKKKRIKHDLESAEAWESEQAIEDNLFNF